MMKKLLLSIMISALMLSLLSGCAKKQEEVTKEATNNEQTDNNTDKDTDAVIDNTEGVSDTVAITHSKGTVEVTKNIKKAVVFDFGVLDTIQALGIDIELAAPVDSLPAYLEEYKDVVNAGGMKEPNLEVIFEFEPDVIFISGRQEAYYDQLSEIAPTIYVNINAQTYLEDFTESVKTIATLFGKVDEANQYLEQISAKVNEVKELSAQSEEKALILLTNDGSLSVYGSGSRFGIIHDLLGVKTADDTIEASTHGQSVGFEYISEVNPDILFVIDRTVAVGGTNLASQTLDNELVNGTNAAQNNKIVSLNPDIWYLSGGGLTSVNTMIDDVKAAIQ